MLTSDGQYPPGYAYAGKGKFTLNGSDAPRLGIPTSFFTAPDMPRPFGYPTVDNVNDFVRTGFLNQTDMGGLLKTSEDIASRFSVLRTFGGGKSGASVYQVIGSPTLNPRERKIYVFKTFHGRAPGFFTSASKRDKAETMSRIVFALCRIDSPDYERAHSKIEHIDEATIQLYINEAIAIVESTGNHRNKDEKAFIEGRLKERLSPVKYAIIKAIAEMTIHFFRGLKDIEVSLILNSGDTRTTLNKISPFIFEYGYVANNPFDPSGTPHLSPYIVSEFVEGVDFSDFVELLHTEKEGCAPSSCNITPKLVVESAVEQPASEEVKELTAMSSKPTVVGTPSDTCTEAKLCTMPKNLKEFITISLLLKIARAIDIFEHEFKMAGLPVGCHRDLHPGNIKIVNNSDDTKEGWIKYWTREQMIDIGEIYGERYSYRTIGPDIILIDFDLSISSNPLINKTAICNRNTNVVKNTLGLPNLIQASLQFMLNHQKLRIVPIETPSMSSYLFSFAQRAYGYLPYAKELGAFTHSKLIPSLKQSSKPGNADLFAWKMLLTSLTDWIPKCDNFKNCMRSAPFRPIFARSNSKNISELRKRTIYDINKDIVLFMNSKDDDHFNLFEMNANLSKTRKGGRSVYKRQTQRRKRI